MSAGRLGSGADVREVAEAARASTSTPAAPTAADQLLDALVIRFTEGYAASVAPLSQALHAIGEGDGDGEERQWLWLACRLAQDLWDDELWYALATRGVRIARETGALSLLPVMANHLAAFHIHAGAFASAAALIEEVDAIAKATGLPPLRYSEIWLAAARGEQAQALFDRGWQSLMTRGEGQGIGMFWRLTAMRHNSRGHYAEALRDAQQAAEHEDVMSYGWALVELIEAGVRDGRPDAAAAALERLTERTQACGTDWALGVEARCRALLSDDELLYQESIERLARSRAAIELARSRLLYGEWLRRENRRTDAREVLRAAHASFSHSGADAFAERARRELTATGETARRVTADTRDALTPQEIQVALLVRDGHTNPEIGAQLFISPRTVEYHLRKVFRKLDVGSRRELRVALKGMSDQAVLGAVSRCRRRAHRCGAASGGGELTLEPVGEADLARERVGGGHEGAVVDRVGAVVRRRRVRDDLARIVLGLQRAADELVHAELLGARDLHDAVHGCADRDPGDGLGDVLGRDRLEQHGRQADGVAVRRQGRDALDELEELRRVDDRVRHRGIPDELLLHALGVEVALVLQTLGADHGQGHVVLHAGRLLGGEQVAGRRREEVEHRGVLERGRVRHVDDHVGALEHLGEAVARERVDPGGGRGGDRLVPVLAELGHDLRADEPGAADDHDLHGIPSVRATRRAASFRFHPHDRTAGASCDTGIRRHSRPGRAVRAVVSRPIVRTRDRRALGTPD